MQRRHLLKLIGAASAALLLGHPTHGLAGAGSLFLEDLTWQEVREAVAAGKIVALVPTGGTEQNGPHMALGKHNVIVRKLAGDIAAQLGNALVAPVLPYVPEGGFDPPEGHMRFPGTMGLSEGDYEAVLRDIATSLASAGFKLIAFLGDHGESQAAQTRVASALTHAWRRRGVHVANLDRYYFANGQEDWLKARGFDAAAIGKHAGLLDTAELAALAPDALRPALMRPRRAEDGSGADGDPSKATADMGARLLALKTEAAVAQVRELLSEFPTR